MTAGAAGATSAAAAGTAVAAAVINAAKASGPIIHVEPETFMEIINKVDLPLVVTATSGFWSTSYRYLMPYGGLYLFTKSSTPLALPELREEIAAKKIWVPEL